MAVGYIEDQPVCSCTGGSENREPNLPSPESASDAVNLSIGHITFFFFLHYRLIAQIKKCDPTVKR